MFYYGPSGTSLGGWRTWRYDKVFSNDFTSIINCSPFDFSRDELDELIETLECILSQVPATDFYGVYQCDEWFFLMGVKSGAPFIVNLGYSYEDSASQGIINKLS